MASSPSQPIPQPLVGRTATVLWPQATTDVAGAASGVGLLSNGNVVYLHRCGYPFANNRFISEPVVLILDPHSGRIKAKWGAGLFKSPHGLTVDAADNVWITDIMRNQVFRFDQNGRCQLVVGKPYPFGLSLYYRLKTRLSQLPSSKDPYILARPTAVSVSQDDSFIVADGYRHHRIAKFDKNGRFLWQVNKFGSAPGAFNLPHSITADAQGRIYVADRSNARIQLFSPQGDWLASWQNPEIVRPFAVAISPDQRLYVADGGDVLYGNSANPCSQIVIMTLSGNIIERWGRWGANIGELRVPHDLAVDAHGAVYVADLQNNRLQKFAPSP